MLDVGWTELVVIAIVLIVVVGPKDLPPMLRTFGKMMSKMRGMATDFRQQFDEALREADLDEVRKTLSDAQKLNPAASLREAMNPLRQMGNDIKADLQKATRLDEKPEATPSDSPPAPEIAASAVLPAEQTTASAHIMSASPVVPVETSKVGGITPLATDMSMIARPRKSAAKVKAGDGDDMGKVVSRKKVEKVLGDSPVEKPRKRKTAGDDLTVAEVGAKISTRKRAKIDASLNGVVPPKTGEDA